MGDGEVHAIRELVRRVPRAGQTGTDDEGGAVTRHATLLQPRFSRRGRDANEAAWVRSGARGESVRGRYRKVCAPAAPGASQALMPMMLVLRAGRARRTTCRRCPPGQTGRAGARPEIRTPCSRATTWPMDSGSSGCVGAVDAAGSSSAAEGCSARQHPDTLLTRDMASWIGSRGSSAAVGGFGEMLEAGCG